MNMLRQLADVIRSMPDALAEAMDRWVIRQHQPAWTEEPGAPCRSCRKIEWPCPTFIETTDRAAQRSPSETRERGA